MSLDWQPVVDWQTPAGETLLALARALPPGEEATICVYGSGPLQMCVDRTLLSADVDVFSDRDLDEIVRAAGLGEGQRAVYIHVGDELAFRGSPRWRDRAHEERVGPVRFRFPHPIDILIAKLARLEPKDLEAFRSVLRQLGFPSAEELKRELQWCVDFYRPGFDEENRPDFKTNTRLLWQELYGSDIDVVQEIIRPARERQARGYDIGRLDYRLDLLRVSKLRPDKS